METFYNNIKTVADRVYQGETKETANIKISSVAYWTQWKIDNGSWQSYIDPDSGKNGKTIIVDKGLHKFGFLGTGSWFAPDDVNVNIQRDIKIHVIYLPIYVPLIDHMETFSVADIFHWGEG